MLSLQQVKDMNKMVVKVCSDNGLVVDRIFSDQLIKKGQPSSRRVRKYKNYHNRLDDKSKQAIIEQIKMCLMGMGILHHIESVDIKRGYVNNGLRTYSLRGKRQRTVEVVTIVSNS